METVLLDELSQDIAALRDVASPDALTQRIVNGLYAAPYRRLVVVHVYNLELPESPIALSERATFANLSALAIPHITGEVTLTSRLHHPAGGHAFLYFEDADYENDAAWMDAKWQDASEILRVLRYIKPNTVDLDYAGVYFEPRWVNAIWRGGVFIMGRARHDAQARQYVFEADTHRTFQRYSAARSTLSGRTRQ